MEHGICHGVAKIGMGAAFCNSGTRRDCAGARTREVPRFGALPEEVTLLLLLVLSINGGHSTELLLELFGELSMVRGGRKKYWATPSTWAPDSLI